MGDTAGLPAGGGELGDLVRAFDWASTPLGPIDTWPRTLTSTVGTVLLSPVPIVLLWGGPGVMIYNDAYSVFAGGRHPQILGSRVREGWPEVADFNDNVMRVGLAGGTLSYRDQELTLRRYGRPEQVWMNLDYSPLLDESGRPAGVIAIVVETTERVLAERALRRSQMLARESADRLQLALSAGAILGTWVWDLAADRFTVDEGFVRNFGLDPALGREGLSLEQVIATVHPDDKARLVAAIDEAIARGGGYAQQYRVRRADGQFYWLEANGRVDHAPDGTPVNFPGVLIDVNERRALQAERDRALAALRSLSDTLEQRVEERTAELMEAEEALRQSQKMEAVGQLTGGIAHDFNNLLAGISGALELIDTRLAQGRSADLSRYVVGAQGAVRRAASLTHRLLAFSRRQTLDPRPLDVAVLVNGMIDLIQRTVGPGIVVEPRAAADVWTVRADASQLENALLNLCINARDAMPGGGRIVIETANRVLAGDGAREAGLAPGDYLALSVSDGGSGMSPDVIAKAFDPFFTTKPLGQGTGLGLSMIYGFARQSGGGVRIGSAVGVGTTVCLHLPRHKGDVQPEPAARTEAARAIGRGGGTVLVVDDEPTVRVLVADVLEDFGLHVLRASDSASGLDILRSDVDIDLLITDVGLPGGLNGRQMADAGRVWRPDLRVLFITGFAEATVLGGGDLAAGMQVLTKPFGLDDLTARVRDLIRRSPADVAPPSA